MTSDPNEGSFGAGVSVSIKQPPSKQYAADGMWLVLHGSVERVSEDIIKAFGIEVAEGATPTLYDLALQADSIAHGTQHAARTLGATSAPKDGEIDPTSAWAQARKEQAKEPEPEVSEADKLAARIAETADVPALRDLYARNEALFKENAELLDAWKAKGRELSEAAK